MATSNLHTWIARSFLILFGLALVVIGVAVAARTVQVGAKPPYGVAGGAVAVVLGLVVGYLALTEVEL